MSILCDAAIRMGLDEKTAHLLTVQTAFGASKLALESSESLDQLSSSVASKGGATEAALSVFAERGLEEMVQQAMVRASERGEELATLWRQQKSLH
jgi:pyrroline-5-carboxylate reductase